MAERRRPLENDDGQGSLFSGDAFAPAHPWDRPEEPAAPGLDVAAPAADAAARAPEAAAASPVDERDAADVPGLAEDHEIVAEPRGRAGKTLAPSSSPAPTEVPSHDELVAGEELAALEQATVAADEPRSPRAPLAGPTLDDVMSRVWEGLATGLPAACPVCQGEIVPSIHGPLHGRCSSCGTTID